ncbi:hypothetical protein P7K49_004341 [Saguinus oedipus]|uniref:Uncharacterized protein n=1 Tax=Saguinus oedipus TaxID=9490 RepID=A0ABQ9W752_SAGOE|nr:hypothetical protein P7K49_004341 [Saguinus oedipus]
MLPSYPPTGDSGPAQYTGEQLGRPGPGQWAGVRWGLNCELGSCAQGSSGRLGQHPGVGSGKYPRIQTGPDSVTALGCGRVSALGSGRGRAGSVAGIQSGRVSALGWDPGQYPGVETHRNQCAGVGAGRCPWVGARRTRRGRRGWVPSGGYRPVRLTCRRADAPPRGPSATPPRREAPASGRPRPRPWRPREQWGPDRSVAAATSRPASPPQPPPQPAGPARASNLPREAHRLLTRKRSGPAGSLPVTAPPRPASGAARSVRRVKQPPRGERGRSTRARGRRRSRSGPVPTAPGSRPGPAAGVAMGKKHKKHKAEWRSSYEGVLGTRAGILGTWRGLGHGGGVPGTRDRGAWGFGQGTGLARGVLRAPAFLGGGSGLEAAGPPSPALETREASVLAQNVALRERLGCPFSRFSSA